jgi:glucose-1-phosphate thymidylyltransferase
VKAIVLAGGYATRLRPLTDSIAKPLLPVGGRPLIDWIADGIVEVAEVDEVHVVTNSLYAPEFERWAGRRSGIRVHDDGTRTNDDRRGAIGDIALTLEQGRLAGDDLLVIAGDNLFDFSLADFVCFWRGKGTASAVAVLDVGDRELAKQYGVAALSWDDRVIDLVEKPAEPRSTLAATATYILHRAHVPLVARYLAEGNSPDQPGKLFVWLHTRAPVFGYRFEGEWFDIGTREQLLEADNRLRAKLGLPVRAEYRLDP